MGESLTRIAVFVVGGLKEWKIGENAKRAKGAQGRVVLQLVGGATAEVRAKEIKARLRFSPHGLLVFPTTPFQNY